MDADADRVKADIYGLVARYSGLHPERITPESRLLHDLGIDGDDAKVSVDGFLQEVQRRYEQFRFPKVLYGNVANNPLANVDLLSAPYGLTSTSFPADQKWLDLSRIAKGQHSIQAQIALAILSGLADELRARGYEVNSPGLARKAAIASFNCKSSRMIVDLFLTANRRQDGIIDCKLEPLGWRRTWKMLPYEEIWREWVQIRKVIDEY